MFGVCMRLFCVCVVLCVGSGLATGWSLAQGVIHSLKMITELNKEARAPNGVEEPLKKKIITFVYNFIFWCRNKKNPSNLSKKWLKHGSKRKVQFTHVLNKCSLIIMISSLHMISSSHSSGYENFYFMGNNAVKVNECFGIPCRLHFRCRRISSVCYLIYAGSLLCWFLEPEDGGDMLLRNVGWLSTDYTALYPRRGNC
jgi:hypothetical protein